MIKQPKVTDELFSFPDPPKRISRPEATWLRHIASEVDDSDAEIETLKNSNIVAEPIRIDEITGRQFTFISDPDNLPVKMCER